MIEFPLKNIEIHIWPFNYLDDWAVKTEFASSTQDR